MREVGYLDITDNKRLVLSISEFRGEERIDLRENYLNKEGAYNPTKKGINFNSEWLDRFITMVGEAKRCIAVRNNCFAWLVWLES